MPALVTTLAVVIGAHAADRYPSRTVRARGRVRARRRSRHHGAPRRAGAAERASGRRVIVENKPGGDGLIGMGEVVRATPDGYTLLVGGFGGQIVPPLMRDDFPFDVRRDIVKIALTAEFGNVLVVNKSLPISNRCGPDRLSQGAAGGSRISARPGAPPRTGSRPRCSC